MTAAQLARLDDDALLDHLAQVAEELHDVTARQEELWAERIAVYQEGRRRDPAITHGRLADAAKVSEVAIITKLRQIEDRLRAAHDAGEHKRPVEHCPECVLVGASSSTG